MVYENPHAAAKLKPRHVEDGIASAPLKNLSVMAAVVLLAQSGFRNILYALVVVGTPITTAGFVYAVIRIHRDRLQHEFVAESAVLLMRDVAEPELIDTANVAPSLADARPDEELRQKLFAMLIARSRFVDVHGAAPSTMTGDHRALARSMLKEDASMLAQLEVKKSLDLNTYLFDWRSDEERLRVLHVQLQTLVHGGASAD